VPAIGGRPFVQDIHIQPGASDTKRADRRAANHHRFDSRFIYGPDARVRQEAHFSRIRSKK